MTFQAPTAKDYGDAAILCQERNKLISFNRGLKRQKHICSHFNVEIRFNMKLNNTNKEQSNKNIYVRIKGGGKTMCEQVRCNNAYPRGQTCKPETQPLVYKSGYTDVFACESSCFQLFGGDSKVKAPLTRFSKTQNMCFMHSNLPYSAATDDYMRADIPTPRVTTIGTGCEVDQDGQSFFDFAGNETFKYTNNHFYCDDFKMEFENGECVPSTAQKINDTFFSSVLYKAIQYGVRKAQTGVGINDIQKVELEPIRLIAKTHEQWRANFNKSACFINPNVTLSELGITPDRRHLFFTTEFGWPGRLVEPIIFIRAPSAATTQNLILQKTSTSDDPNLLHIDFTKNTDKILPQFKYDAYGRRYHDEFDLINTQEHINEIFKNDQKNSLKQDYGEDATGLVKFLTSLPNLIVNPEFWVLMGTSFSNELVNVVKKAVMKTLVRLERDTTTHTIAMVIRTSMINTLVNRSGYIGRRLAMNSLKIFASALKVASVVGIIADLISIVDLFFIASDPFKLNNLNGPKFLDTFSEMDLMANELEFGFKTVEFSPAYYFAMSSFAESEQAMKSQDKKSVFNLKDDENEEINKNNKEDDVTPSKAATNNLNTPADNINNHGGDTEFDYMYTEYEKPVWGLYSNDIALEEELFAQIRWQTDYLFSLSRNSNGLLINWHLEDSVCTFHEFNKFIDKIYDPQSIINYNVYIKNAYKRFNLLNFGTITILIALIISFLFFKTFIPVFILLLFAIGLFSSTFAKI